jgi:ribokinase
MFDIITFGSATQDIFLQPKSFKIIEEKKFITGKGLCLSLGSKIQVKDIHFLSGGGGTNTAVAFAKQGFKTAFCGMVGMDSTGQEIIKELQKSGVITQLIKKTGKKPTNYSVILSPSNQERTILVYCGASSELAVKDIPWSKIKAKWLYLAPLSGKLCNIFEKLVNFAKKNGMKIALNPGRTQLSLPRKKLVGILEKVDVLILNQEEACFLSGIPFNKEKEIFKKIDDLCPGIAIMTKGPLGVLVSDGKYIFRAGALKVQPVDRTGAGDAFASGFISGLIRKKGDIVQAIQLGIANSAACLKELGAKKGLLTANQNFSKVKVRKEKCLATN